MTIYSKILVAIDISDESEQILHKASVMAKQNLATLDIVHVVEPVIIENSYDLTPHVDLEIEDSLVVRSKSFISGLISKLGMSIDNILVPVGSTKLEIHRTAKQQGSDLIIIGTHGRHGVSLLLGSTASAVLHGAPCDVLAVKVSKIK